MTDANTDTGSVFSRIKYAAFGTAMKDLILADVGYALAGVDILGLKPLAFLKGWADGLVQDAANALNGAAQAQAGVAATNTQLSLTGAQPLHVGVDQTADPTIQAVTATDNINTNATHANWGFIRMSRQAQASVITYIGKVSGTVTALYFDVYRLDPTSGDVTLVYSSANQAGLLGAAYSVQQVVLPTPIPVDYGDIIGIQARMGGAGTVWLQGKVTGGVSNTIARPYQLGAQRDPSSSAAPSTIVGATMDTLYNAAVPYFTFGSATQPTEIARNLSDNFGNGLGAWVLGNNTGHNMAISGGQLAFVGTTDGDEWGIYQTPLLTDNFDCSTSFASLKSIASNFLMATDIAGNTGVALSYLSSQLGLYTFTGGPGGSYTSRATTSGNSGPFYITFRSGVWTVYQGTDTTGPQLLTWTEPGSGGPAHGAGHRFFGYRTQRAFFTNSPSADNFSAKDV